MATFLFALVLLAGCAVGLNNGVALAPPMGWNPYNVYQCETDEVQYRAAATALVHSGLRDRGYQYLNLDCGWQSTERTASGTITWNATRIPSGIPALSDYVHSLDLLFGMFSDAGYYSCDYVNGTAHWLGSLGYEESDANTFARWGADYLKYDSCFVASRRMFIDFYPHLEEQPRYTTMRDALAKTGRKIVYSISEWGIQDPARWAWDIGNSWRISSNIGPQPSFESLKRVINQVVPITLYAAPGGWNDLDLLEVGNDGLTQTEWGTHFAFWAASKSPLLVSTDMTTISTEALDILSNERLIAINQDPLGMPIAFMRRYTGNYDVWAGPLSDGSTVAVLVNWMNTPNFITFNLIDIGFTSGDLMDVWTGDDLGSVNGTHMASVDAHGSLVYKLLNGVQAPLFQYTLYSADASSNVLTGGASLRVISDTVTVVGNIGYGNTLTFVGVDGGSNGGTKLLWLSYVNADYAFFNTDCSNCRRAEVSVNGGTPVVVEMPISGQSWDIVYDAYVLSMDGFVPGLNNNIMFANSNGWAPDMYTIGVEE